jgi:hypothetical protein
MPGQSWAKVSGSVLVATAFLCLLAGCSGMGGQPAVASADSPSAQQLPFTDTKPLLPVNTAIYIRLQQPLSSATAQAGETFEAVLDEPLRVNEQVLAPQGATVKGKVLAARASGHLHNPGYLRITLASLTINGKTVPLQTDSISVRGGSFRNRNYAFIGGGAAGGALIGALAGGGKGAAVGALIGGGGGTAAAYATGKNEVGFAAERRLGFRLMQALEF